METQFHIDKGQNTIYFSHQKKIKTSQITRIGDLRAVNVSKYCLLKHSNNIYILTLE